MQQDDFYVLAGILHGNISNQATLACLEAIISTRILAIHGRAVCRTPSRPSIR